MNSECFCFTTVDDAIRRITVQALKSFHEEADTWMVFHLDFVSRVRHVSNITIRSNDTDVLIIPLYHIANTEDKTNVWLDAGLNSNNTRRLITINNIVKNLTKEVALALPGLHALTGCDYVPTFFSKGKIKPFELMKKHSIFTQCRKALGNGEINEETTKQCSTFVCHLYGQPKEIDVNQARHMIFQKIYAPKTLEDPLDSIKCVNPMVHCHLVLQLYNFSWRGQTMWPPCGNELHYRNLVWTPLLAMDGTWIATCIASTGIMAISCLQTYTEL